MESLGDVKSDAMVGAQLWIRVLPWPCGVFAAIKMGLLEADVGLEFCSSWISLQTGHGLFHQMFFSLTLFLPILKFLAEAFIQNFSVLNHRCILKIKYLTLYMNGLMYLSAFVLSLLCPAGN